jgi:hypothetical protein
MYLKAFTALLFIIPAVLTYLQGMYFYSAIILFSMVFSFLYHLHHERKYKLTDAFFSVALMLTNVYFIYRSDFISPFTEISLVIAGLSFYFWFRSHTINYNLNHSLWHLSSLLITLSCIMGYIYFSGQ